MNTAVINIKTEAKVKKQAQKVADELGLSLSTAINGFLRYFIKAKAITFSLAEEPSDYLLEVLKESEKDIKAGRVSPGFTDADEAIAWLENPKRKYANQIQPKVR